MPLSPGKFNKYEYLTGEKILPSGPIQIIGQAKFKYTLQKYKRLTNR